MECKQEEQGKSSLPHPYYGELGTKCSLVFTDIGVSLFGFPILPCLRKRAHAAIRSQLLSD